ncbi:C1 family peptidase [Butyrivibrio proteoclasticus]|uniref:C1 family peptidase n=1 Tax=Butyrivibrio proteoclasticus TaxID=43305 RepID=UPI00047CB66D|nr:C1 family peptidase [Butyrivibrio proteoclasticus]
MKKRTTVIVIICAVLCVVIAGVLLLGKNEPVNNSRRDGAVVSVDGDADLEGLDGSLSASEDRSRVYVPPADDSNMLTESVIVSDATRALSENVESVRTITLPEAVTIADGDVAAFYGNADFEDVVPVDAATFNKTDIPSKYDSRNVDGNCYVTAVEDQGYSYLCWSFACMGAIESDILVHNPNISYKDLDLSEKHLAYYNMHRAEGSANSYIDDDYRELVNADGYENAWVVDNDTGYIAMGGVTDFCLSILTAWKGPVPELGTDKFVSVYGESYLFSDNKEVPSDAYASVYHIQDVGEFVASLDNNALIKQMVMEHGAVTVGVNADNKYWKSHSKTLYSSFGGENAPTANHEVLIVGWDDDYAASNFSATPPGNGAWICKNSWGTSSGENGYFYLSYYDETTNGSNAAYYNAVSEGAEDYYDCNYQVAGFITNVESSLDDSLNSVYAFTKSANPYGVLYTAGGNENLDAVGFMALDSYQQYKICIYINPEVKDGSIVLNTLPEPALCQKVSAISGGYHSFQLEKEIKLSKDDTFLVIVNPETKGRLVYEKASTNTSQANFDEWSNLTGNVYNNYVASGCSYYISEDAKELIRQDDKDFFLKAYTKKRDD